MRNYIILNNQNSNTISGLIIQELAPISKPLQRTQVETIDGRDGDIVTPLGYAAYNKKIKIGLYGNFDINEVIAYFATKGTVIFSNEPDKYYYYQIVDQIDYERLVRYRVATVTMHVQPFKYSATEGTITVDSSDTVSGEGSDIALDGTAEAPFNVLRHKGNATQTAYTGKNLINSVETHKSANSSGVISSGNTNYLGVDDYTPCEPNTTYTVTFEHDNPTANIYVSYRDANDNFIERTGYSTNRTFTTPASAKKLFFYLNKTGVTFETIGGYVQLEESSQPSDYEPYVGGIPSPNPDYPQDIQVVTGDSTVKIMGKNLFNRATAYENSGLKWAEGEPFAEAKSISSADYTPISAGQKVCLNYRAQICFYDINKAFLGALQSDGISIGKGGGGTFLSFTAPNITKIAFVRFGFRTGVNDSQDMNTKDIMVNLGATSEPYEPYIEQSYVLPLGDTYLAKIGDYADEPVNVDGTWYIRRAIGKVVLDGHEAGWVTYSTSTAGLYRYNLSFNALKVGYQNAICDYFTMTDKTDFTNINTVCFATHPSQNLFAFYSNEPTKAAWTTWLGTHNITVYYVLATPTDEAITDQDLIDALDELYDQAHSYKGHTHITATAADGNAPAVLSVEVGEDNESTVTNAGNTTSRPILTIYGQGDIGVYINDVEVLDVALGDEGYITLDSVEMEAYKDTTANLKNRLVTGDYSKLALNAGDNKIRFTGTVTKYEISKYSRWL